MERILVIDVYNAGGNTLMWRGSGARPARKHPGLKQTSEQVNETAEKSLNQLPPLQWMDFLRAQSRCRGGAF